MAADLKASSIPLNKASFADVVGVGERVGMGMPAGWPEKSASFYTLRLIHKPVQYSRATKEFNRK